MVIGIMPNISKERMVEIVSEIASYMNGAKLEFLISENLKEIIEKDKSVPFSDVFVSNDELYKQSDMILSIGGDGTMLNTAYESRFYDKPLFGVNVGKLGFLSEFTLNKVEQFLREIKRGEYFIEQRTTLEATCRSGIEKNLFALNDIVIDKGRWPKMIDLRISIDDEYVSSFSADGVIIATPTGSTGYSLSAGGPIIDPHAAAFAISPLSPHTLTMRPLVISTKQTIKVEVDSPYKSVQVNCDGQRVYDFEPPVCLDIKKSDSSVQLVHSKSFGYFDTLRTKLFWGLDVRNNK